MNEEIIIKFAQLNQDKVEERIARGTTIGQFASTKGLSVSDLFLDGRATHSGAVLQDGSTVVQITNVAGGTR